MRDGSVRGLWVRGQKNTEFLFRQARDVRLRPKLECSQAKAKRASRSLLARQRIQNWIDLRSAAVLWLAVGAVGNII